MGPVDSAPTLKYFLASETSDRTAFVHNPLVRLKAGGSVRLSSCFRDCGFALKPFENEKLGSPEGRIEVGIFWKNRVRLSVDDEAIMHRPMFSDKSRMFYFRFFCFLFYFRFLFLSLAERVFLTYTPRNLFYLSKSICKNLSFFLKFELLYIDVYRDVKKVRTRRSE